MTRAEVVGILRGFVRDFKIDPVDAGSVLAEIGDGVDAETLGDYLEGVGYPELASEVYGVESTVVVDGTVLAVVERHDLTGGG